MDGSEKKWLREIKQGRTEYLSDIAEKYYDDIYRFCCYLTGNPENSYDLAQETFLRFIQYAENYREHNLKGYLLTIANHVCRDYFRRQPMDISYEEAKDSPGLLDYGENGSSMQADGTEDAMVLMEALARLPMLQREAIVLHYYGQLRYREIAAMTGTGTATVKSRVRQGMEKLEKLLNKEDFYG